MDEVERLRAALARAVEGCALGLSLIDDPDEAWCRWECEQMAEAIRVGREVLGDG